MSPAPSGVQTAAVDPEGDFMRRWAAAMQAWRSGLELVDEQIEALGKHLKASDDTRLRNISQTGLNAITGNHKVRVMAALQDVSHADPATLPRLAAKAAQQVLDFQDHLSRDSRVAACDSNPFGVTVAVRQTLVPLLGRLEGLLSSAAASG
jgi:hypothetical protein